MPSMAGRCGLLLLFAGSALAEDLEVYVGAGCFWHVQAAVNIAEETVLGLAGENVTGITGYAGGRDNGGKICYNTYGGKGHTEVIAFTVPKESLGAVLAKIWPKLFPNGDRSDRVNRGAEYRSALGLPGGVGNAELMAAVHEVKGESVLVAGSGDEPDSLGDKKVFVYDTRLFPFHQAELYHQFHDYGGRNAVRLLANGRLREIDCPSEFLVTLTQPFTLVILGALALMVCACTCRCWLNNLRSGEEGWARELPAPATAPGKAGAAATAKVAASEEGALPRRWI